MDKDIRFMFGASDKASPVFDKVGGKSKSLAASFRKLKGDVTQFARIAGEATTAILKYANGWDQLEAKMKAANSGMSESTDNLIDLIGTKWDREKERIGTIIDPKEQEAAMQAMAESVNKGLEKYTEEWKRAQQEVEEVQGGWIDGIPVIGENFAEATKIEKEGAEQRAAEAKKLMDAYAAQAKEVNYLVSEEKKLADERKAAFDKAKASTKYLESLQEEVDALKLTKAELADREAVRTAANEADLAAARALIAERDALEANKKAQEEWAEAKKKAMDDAGQAVRDFTATFTESLAERAREQNEEKQRVDDLYTDAVENLKRERIAFEQGEEAARKYELTMQGLSDAKAAEIAAGEEALRREIEARDNLAKPAKAPAAPGDLTGREGRLLTGRGVSMDYARVTADETKKTNAKLDKAFDAYGKMIRELEKIRQAPPVLQGV